MSSMYGLKPDMNHLHGVHDPHMNGLSLQEMIDTDIKAEFDDVMTSNPLSFGGIESLELLDNLDTQDAGCWMVDELLNHPVPWHNTNPQVPNTSNQPEMSALHSSYFDDSLTGTAMVNPNNVIPIQNIYNGPPSHTPSPVPPMVGSQHSNLTVNTGYTNTHLNLQSPSPSPISPKTYPMQTQHHQQYQFVNIHPTHHKTLKIMPPVSSPLQQVPSPNGGVHHNSGPLTPNSMMRKKVVTTGLHSKDSGFPKPAYSYSCLIALALKNSRTGSMSVSEIYKFMCEHFPYFKTAPNGWKNSVRHNLSLNKCFEKIEKPASNGTNQRKGCLWAMNKEKIIKMDEEVKKWSRKDPMAIKKAMYYPNTLEALERGEMVKDYNANSTALDSEDDEDPRTPASVSSQGSQGYASAENDFVDMESFPHLPDNSIPELNLQAVGGIYEDMSMVIHRKNRSPTEISSVGPKIIGGPVGKSVFIPQRYTANYSINHINFAPIQNNTEQN